MLARIRTRFPQEVQDLCDILIEAGYVVEVVRPEEMRISPADIEFCVDKLPAVEAWKNIPNADTVYVSLGVPESRDVRSHEGRIVSQEPFFARILVNLGESVIELSNWCLGQLRELRARANAWRERVTPPREYEAAPHLDPSAPSNVASLSVESVIAKMRLQRDERRRERANGEKELAERAQIEAENRRRAREASEAKALLEKQQQIESMVRATVDLRERVLHHEHAPTMRPPRPRRLLRTRRDRSVARAGMAAFALAMGLAVLGGSVLHPRSVSTVVPKTSATAAAAARVPKPSVAMPAAQESAKTPQKPVNAIPTVTNDAVLGATVLTADAQSPRSKHAQDDEQEVIVRKAIASRPRPKAKDGIAHYSDLD